MYRPTEDFGWFAVDRAVGGMCGVGGAVGSGAMHCLPIQTSCRRIFLIQTISPNITAKNSNELSAMAIG